MSGAVEFDRPQTARKEEKTFKTRKILPHRNFPIYCQETAAMIHVFCCKLDTSKSF